MVRISGFLRTGIAVCAISVGLAAAHAASGEFIFRYKTGLPIAELPGSGGNPGGGATDPTDPTDPVDPTGPTGPVLACSEDEKCYTDPCTGLDTTAATDTSLNGACKEPFARPLHVYAPVTKLLVGQKVTESYWFYMNYVLTGIFDSVNYEVVRESEELPPGVSLARWGDLYFTNLTGTATAIGDGAAVMNIYRIDENGNRMEKVSDLTMRAVTTDVPANIVQPPINVYVGDYISNHWFEENYGGALWQYGGIAIQETEDSGWLEDLEINWDGNASIVGQVTEHGTATIEYDIYRFDDEGNWTDVISHLTQTISSTPYLHMAQLVGNSGGVYPVVEPGETIYTPWNLYEDDAVAKPDDTPIAGAMILGLTQDSCSSVDWKWLGDFPPSLELKSIPGGVLMVTDKSKLDEDGNAWKESWKQRYDMIRLQGDCKDSTGSTMVRYLTPTFSIVVDQPG